ncbi:nucleotidyltransferase domain-containing protein [Candidatus Saganbacteria bacterium]|nr:nucleotidyltransferase domain-containing protein [Candidatus Saganbacteria bacterium]
MRKIKLINKPKPVDFEEIIPKMQAICQDHGIDLLYLFGGTAKGCSSRLSDIDIAFYSKVDLTGKDILSLNKSFVEVLKRDDLDLVDLKTANPYICYMAIKNGKLLFCPNNGIKSNIEASIQKNFLDTIYLRDKFHAYQYNAIMKGGFYVSTR